MLAVRELQLIYTYVFVCAYKWIFDEIVISKIRYLQYKFEQLIAEDHLLLQ